MFNVVSDIDVFIHCRKEGGVDFEVDKKHCLEFGFGPNAYTVIKDKAQADIISQL